MNFTSHILFNAFLLLDSRIITKNIKGKILRFVSLELFKLIDLINQSLACNSGWVIFLQETDKSGKFEEDIFILFVIAQFLQNLRAQLSNGLLEKSIVLQLFEGMRFNQYQY
jgi:hypothetical protein